MKVTLAEAPTDVLVWLADQPADHWWTVNGIADGAAPSGLARAEQLSGVAKALALLIEGGYAEGASMDGFPGYRATQAGREAVSSARDAGGRL